MAERTLEVWCFDERAGVLTDEPDGLTFDYAEGWEDAGRPPLSHSLPPDGSYTTAAVQAFFGGLLPEGAPRERAARNLGVSAGNDFALLAALGGDTAGAISLLAKGERPVAVGGDVQWLDESQLATLIDELPARPLHADEDGEYRLSLAGAQDKLPVIVADDGRIGLTKGRTPSTHILKTPIADRDGTIANEALCPAIGRLLGIETVRASPHRVAGREFLLVERYDREHTEQGVRRLHQEDFCQALGIPATRKYQNEGGPGLADCFALLRATVAVPAREALRLLDAVVLSFLIGNNDAHGKNYSLLYVPDSRNATLAPAYDLLSTVVYRGLSRKMATSIGGEYRPDYVQPRHLNQLLEQAGLGPAAARRRIRNLAGAAPAAAHQARAALAEEGWDVPAQARIVETVEKRASRMLEIAASARVRALPSPQLPCTPMSTATPIEIDAARVEELTQRELAALNERTASSARMYERAGNSLSGGVASSYQLRDPWPIYLATGEGPRVTDIDGNEYWDFHNGFGSMVQGHAHPAIVKAVSERVALGTHFAAVTEDTVIVAEELAKRFNLERWRIVNSGSEATMDAIRIARALTGRETIMKIFGSYHGHHDAVMVSIGVPYDEIGDRDNLASLPYGAGIPRAVTELTIPVPFNDADAMERRIERLEREDRKPACVIMEAAMMNLGVVLPLDGYLQQVREITERHDIVLIFDEVKTGLAIAAGGATERFGVQPDMVTMAKTLGGGLPAGAIGGTERVMSVVEDGSVYQVGTYNGNPLTMAAARASLQEVLTPAAYEHLDALNDRILAGCEAVIERHRLPGYAVGIGSKGCVTFSPTPVVDYESFKASQDVAVTELAWLWNMNRGIYMTPGREEEWTLSVTHTDEAVDAYVQAFDEMAAALTS